MKLIPHEGHPPRAIRDIEVTVERYPDNSLYFWWVVCGDTNALELSEIGSPTRGNELWRTTCFELFIERQSGGYWEFNFSPSTKWAAYQFDSYRFGRRDLELEGVPEIEQDSGSEWYEFEIWVRPPKTFKSSDRMGISAVMEEKGGIKSYWALAHPDGPPDFHNRACFAYHLAPFEPE